MPKTKEDAKEHLISDCIALQALTLSFSFPLAPSRAYA